MASNQKKKKKKYGQQQQNERKSLAPTFSSKWCGMQYLINIHGEQSNIAYTIERFMVFYIKCAIRGGKKNSAFDNVNTHKHTHTYE